MGKMDMFMMLNVLSTTVLILTMSCHEVCFCYNEDTLTIVDVNDKQNMVALARVPYSGAQYTHQGWLTPDHQFLFLNDELDEQEGTAGGIDGRNTRTLFWNVANLTAPVWTDSFISSHTVIDHNLYVKDNYVYEANYCGGLRVLSYDYSPDGSNPTINEVAYFDVDPVCDSVLFRGSWSNYPYFESGNVIISSI